MCFCIKIQIYYSSPTVYVLIFMQVSYTLQPVTLATAILKLVKSTSDISGCTTSQITAIFVTHILGLIML